MSYRLIVTEDGIQKIVKVAELDDIRQIDEHINNQSNPHNVTAVQTGAVPESGGVFSGNITIPAATADGHALNRGTANTLYVKVADLASQAQAEAGSNNTQWMSPLRVKQAIDALGGGGGLWSQDGSDIYYNSGNVGIGVVPDELFHLKTATDKNLRIYQDATFGGMLIFPSTDAKGGIAVRFQYDNEFRLRDGTTTTFLIKSDNTFEFSHGGIFGGNISIPNATAGGHAVNRTTAGGHAVNRTTADGRYAQLSGATFTGLVTIRKSSGGESLKLRTDAAGNNHFISFYNSSNVRQGYIGWGSVSNDHFIINADTGVLRFRAGNNDVGWWRTNGTLEAIGEIKSLISGTSAIVSAERSDNNNYARISANSGGGALILSISGGSKSGTILRGYGTSTFYSNIATVDTSQNRVVTIADNGFAKIGDMQDGFGMALVVAEATTGSSPLPLIVAYTDAGPNTNKIAGAAGWNTASGTPTGTSGSDGFFTFYVNSSGELFIENRASNTYNFKFLLIG